MLANIRQIIKFVKLAIDLEYNTWYNTCGHRECPVKQKWGEVIDDRDFHCSVETRDALAHSGCVAIFKGLQ